MLEFFVKHIVLGAERDEKGATATEYGLLVGLIATGVTGPGSDMVTLDLGPNWRVLAFTILVAIGTASASGVIPAHAV